MSWILRLLKSSIGKKQFMALFGLMLAGFLVMHLIGNLFLYVGQEAFEAYVLKLEKIPFLLALELGLAGVFLVHIVWGIMVTIGNIAARRKVTSRYAVNASKGEATLANTTMPITGILVLVFLIVHIYNLRLARYRGGYDYGLYGATIQLFKNPAYALFYVACVCVLGAHLWHGIQSASRTFGFQHPKYFPVIVWVSRIFAVVIALGFASIPVWALTALPPWDEFKQQLEPYAPTEHHKALDLSENKQLESWRVKLSVGETFEQGPLTLELTRIRIEPRPKVGWQAIVDTPGSPPSVNDYDGWIGADQEFRMYRVRIEGLDEETGEAILLIQRFSDDHRPVRETPAIPVGVERFSVDSRFENAARDFEV